MLYLKGKKSQILERLAQLKKKQIFKHKNQKITKVIKFTVSPFMVGKQQFSCMTIISTKVVVCLQTLASPQPRIKLFLL